MLWASRHSELCCKRSFWILLIVICPFGAFTTQGMQTSAQLWIVRLTLSLEFVSDRRLLMTVFHTQCLSRVLLNDFRIKLELVS